MGGIPNNLIWVAVILLIYNFITSKTTIGRYFYTIGGNVEATRLSGIDTKKIFFLAYLNMAVLTVISAWMTMGRLSAATATAGNNYEMDAISMRGGRRVRIRRIRHRVWYGNRCGANRCHQPRHEPDGYRRELADGG